MLAIKKRPIRKKKCSEKGKYADYPDYICNPASGRWVKKDGPTGKKILAYVFYKEPEKRVKKAPMAKSEIDRLSNLPRDMLITIMLGLEPEDLKHLCSVNKRIQTICADPSFRKQYREMPYEPFRQVDKAEIEKKRYYKFKGITNVLYCPSIVVDWNIFPSKEVIDKLGKSDLYGRWYFETANKKYIIYLRSEIVEYKGKNAIQFDVYADPKFPYIHKFVKWFNKKYNFKCNVVYKT